MEKNHIERYFMSDKKRINPYAFTVFRPGTPAKQKTRGIVFFIIFSLIVLVQSFYWLFANSVKPYILGMPFGLFFVALFIVIEFVVLIILYKFDYADIEK